LSKVLFEIQPQTANLVTGCQIYVFSIKLYNKHIP
jgi:hypothetical protein